MGFERTHHFLVIVSSRQICPCSVQTLGCFLQKLKELFAFCLTCLLSTGFAGPVVVCQANCKLLGLLCLSIVISLLLSTNFLCCLLRCSLKTLLARFSKLKVGTHPKLGPRTCILHNVRVVQAVADTITSSVLQIHPSPPACLSLSTEATTEIMATGKLENLTCMMAMTKTV